MSDNQNEETEQSGPTEEPEVEGFAVIPGLKPIKGRSNIKRGHTIESGMSTGLGPSDFGMKMKEPKDRPGLAVSDPGSPAKN